jgi:hypothetical protein
MKRVTPFLLVCLMALNIFAASPQRPRQAFSFASNFAVVPSMANVPGLFGAVWKTKVELFNPTASDYSIQAALYDKTGKVDEKTITITAGQLRSYQNFLSDVFGFGGAGAVKFDSGSDQNQFVLNAEVYTDTANGRYITPVPGLVFDASNSVSYSLGVSVDSNNRTNIGAFNDSSSPNTVAAEVYDSSGTLVTTLTLNLAPNAWNQIAVPSNVSGGFIEFTPTLPAFCYAVVVNNTSNDGDFVQAAEVGQ